MNRLESLINYYNYIDFSILSKVEILDKPIDNDAIIIFELSNILHKFRSDNYTITNEDLEYINKIKQLNYGKSKNKSTF